MEHLTRHLIHTKRLASARLRLVAIGLLTLAKMLAKLADVVLKLARLVSHITTKNRATEIKNVAF